MTKPNKKMHKFTLYLVIVALLISFFVPFYPVYALSISNINITRSETFLTTKWQTDIPSSSIIEYGVSPTQLNRKMENTKKVTSHQITLYELDVNLTYYIQLISVVDNVRQASGVFAVSIGDSQPSPTPSNSTNTQTGNQSNSQAITAIATDIQNCKINFANTNGFYGYYYNLPENHPDVTTSRTVRTRIPAKKTAAANDWYDSKYYSFSQVDQKLNFKDKFHPVNEGLAGDPAFFAVHWKAIINVPSSGNYQYTVTSNDDSWIFINGKLATDLGGMHPSLTDKKTIYLSAGYHEIEIYYADRTPVNAVMVFSPDSSLKFYPLPKHCNLSSVVAYNQSLTTATQTNNNTGTVLGVTNITEVTTTPTTTVTPTTTATPTSTGTTPIMTPSKYACNPNLGYTPFVALYRSNIGPDVWALLPNGQKHYITSPASLAKYGCSWNEVKIVSRSFLNSIPNANLVRAINNPKVYFLFQRPQQKWLKIGIPSATVFVSYSNNYWGNIITIDQLDINAYPDTKLITTANNPAIYVIENNQKRLISSTAVFERNNYNWAEVTTINQMHLDTFRDGSIIQ